jgi:hypothetical protein
MAKNTNKTQLTEESVSAALDAMVADPQERKDCDTLIDIMEKVTGHPAKMWGPAIVGFDQYHYKYESGREGDACLIGFSPRKGKFSLYILRNFDGRQELLDKLGKHKVQGSCLHFKRISDIDTGVLEELCRRSTDYMRKAH